jgi:anthranilate synthase component 1
LQLCDEGRKPDTLLLESLDARTKHAVRSFVIPKAAVRAECRGSTVALTALTPTGRCALTSVRPWLAEHAEVEGEADRLVATYPEPPAQASESERLAAPSVFDALRALTLRWTVKGGAAAAPLLTAGVFAYDLLDAVERLPQAQADPLGFPDYVFWLPEQLVVCDHERRSTTVAAFAFGGEGAETSYHDAVAAVAALTEAVSAPDVSRTTPPPTLPLETVAAQVDTDDEAYAAQVTELKQRIVAGDVFQVVPSRTFRAPCPDPAVTYLRLRELNPSPYMFYVAGPDHTLFGASPETCVKVGRRSGGGRAVEVRPIAGTARRGRGADGSLDLDLDGRLEAELRLDEKELAEHMMLIDLARNDVARVSEPGTRHVPRLLTVDRYSHVMHLVSYVEGELRADLDALHAYAASMNMGTLVGAPKLRAAELLREREATRRGPYGGAVGYLTHGGDLDTAIVIRSAVVKDGEAFVRAGAGVVHDSRPVAEANETRAKAQAVLVALGATS